MTVIGLTGGIGVGKSTVAALLGERGAVVIDVDALGRDVIDAGGTAVDAVVARFGPKVLAEDGSISRPALAEIVFADPDALTALNTISHPLINELLDDRIGAVLDDDPNVVVVLDMAILAESQLGQGIENSYQRVVVVETELGLRIERLIDRGMAEEQARARMAAQASDADRRALADHIITNNGSIDDLAMEVESLWSRLADH